MLTKQKSETTSSVSVFRCGSHLDGNWAWPERVVRVEVGVRVLQELRAVAESSSNCHGVKRIAEISLVRIVVVLHWQQTRSRHANGVWGRRR